MRKLLIIFPLISFLIACTHHPTLNKDLLVSNICNSFQTDDIVESDSIKVLRIFKKHLTPYLEGLSDDSANALINFFYIRLQRECTIFNDIASRLDRRSKKSDWNDIDIEPESQISEDDYNSFFTTQNFKYLESNGDTTKVHITDSTWKDSFLDGTYSSLSLKKLNQKEFVITFIESNNTFRKDFSRPGDQYRYKIVKKDEGSYTMFVQPVGSKIKSLFKMYY